jgi:hypothetical protein
MSSALAIASVTAVLKYWLEASLHPVSSASHPPAVSVMPPSRINAENNDEMPLLNLFLYHVTPNIGWRNVGLPSRSDRGQRLTNPPLALDLYYLLTAYEKKDFDAEILLGYAVQTLHEMPVLTRDAIRKALDNTALASGETLSSSNLGDQIELIKLTPQVMNIEEISKLWAAFSASYRPSVAYQASVVLIEGTKAERSPLPVLTLGKDDRGIISHSNIAPPCPTLREVKPPRDQISACLGDLLIIQGYNLDAPDVKLGFMSRHLREPIEVDPLKDRTLNELKVILPRDTDLQNPKTTDPSSIWPAGLYSLSAAFGAGGERRVTNELAVSIAPVIVSADVDADNRAALVVTFNPQMRQGQRASLLLGDIELRPEIEPKSSEWTTYRPPTYKLAFDISTIPKGEYAIRLRIDGVDSQFIDHISRPPAFIRRPDFDPGNPSSITVVTIP